MYRALCVGIALIAGPAIVAAAEKPAEVVGAKAPNSTLSGLDGKAVTLDSVRGKTATVIVFISFDCPVSNSYIAGINEQAGPLAEKGVAVVLVCLTDEPREAVAKAAAGFKLAVPVAIDSKKELAAGVRARATPEAFVLDGDGVVRYRGRIDDAYSSRLKRNPKVTTHELRDAIESVAAGKAVEHPVTTPVGCTIDFDAAAPKAGGATYARDVAVILNKHCVICHRPGEVAPFSLVTYNQARRWASDIKDYTQNKQMPPWMPATGLPMRGERKLSPQEITTLAAWADAGAPEGDPREAPPAPDFGDGWRNGKPDLILSPSRDFHLAANGNDLFRVFVIPTELTQDKWVVGYDVRPGNPRVVHHTLNFFDGTGQGRELERKQQEKDKDRQPVDHGPGYNVAMGVGFVAQPPRFGGIGGWAPGQAPQFLPAGAGWLLPKGSDFLVQTHYHRNGQAADDHTQIGLYFAKSPVDLPWQTRIIQGLRPSNVIPAGASDYVARGIVYFHTDATLHNVLPHMHLLGKSVTVTMTPPGKPPVVLVDIPNWDYRWQETYWFKEPIAVKAGTRVEVVAHFDNSEANPNNPSHPPKNVSYGEQTTDEMLFAFMGVTSAVKPSQRVVTYTFPPKGVGEPPIQGQLTPLLEGLVGNWETATQTKVFGRSVELKGKEVAEKVFDGSFVRSVATTEADVRSLVFQYTFDPKAKAYRLWTYDPQGTELEWSGSYDEASKTLTWKAMFTDQAKGEMTWKFAPGGGYTWDLIITTDGKISIEVHGDRTKKKE